MDMRINEDVVDLALRMQHRETEKITTHTTLNQEIMNSNEDAILK